MYNINKLINTKVQSGHHTSLEISNLINFYTREQISDIDMTLWLKAVCKNGMNVEETVDYTRSIVKSGKLDGATELELKKALESFSKTFNN